MRQGGFKVLIDYYDEHDKKQLVTSLIGDMIPMSKTSLRHAFWTHPLVTFKAIALIHWQAVKLLAKGIKYIVKPKQKEKTLSATDNLTKV